MRVEQIIAELLQTCTGPVSGKTIALFVGVLGALRSAIPVLYLENGYGIWKVQLS
jgi:hypothetical protein